MEELKNEYLKEQETEEPVIEQRPSTKYGRTAYQQQLKEEQEKAAKEALEATGGVEYHQTYQQSSYQNQGFYTSYEEPQPALKKTYVTVLMVLIAISGVIAFISNVMAAEAYTMGDTLEEITDAILMIASQPVYQGLTMISDTVFFAMIAFFVLDISQLRRAGKNTRGAIFFAIFLRPAYFIWRAHLLGEKKTVPIIYMVIFYMVMFAEIYIVMQGAMEMVMRTMY